jgi:hypothetical protein
VLEGPFAVVLSEAKPDQVTVFTPMDPKKAHGFYMNDEPQDQTKTHVMKFVADAGALRQNPTRPDISDPCLKRFTWPSEQAQAAGDDLVEISLPSPDKILCGRRSQRVTFEDRSEAEMWSPYILQYTVTDPSKKVLIIDESTQREFTARRADSHTLNFHIEVGLPKVDGGNSDPDEAHAIAFFNGYLLPRFPPIKDDKHKRLGKIGTPGKHIIPFGTHLECGLGSIIVPPKT